MANFPNSVTSFSNKQDGIGQIIAASHVNTLQDEVAAIEDGYLNGTARLNSSHSTVAALSVSGGSTFAVRPMEPPPDAVRLSIGSTLAVVSGQFPVVNWLTQDYITNSSMHSSVTDSSRVVPQSTGVYCATFQATFNFNSSGYRDAYIMDSSGATVARSRVFVGTQNAVTTVQVSGTKRFDALGGFLKAAVSQSDASTMSLTAADTWFEVRKL